MDGKMLGRITKATFGFGGYDEAMFGLSLTFTGGGDGSWGCGHFEGPWSMEPSEHTQWTKESQIKQMYEACWLLKDTLVKAKKKDVSQLVGVPVECTFEGNLLKSWRVLEEVL